MMIIRFNDTTRFEPINAIEEAERYAARYLEHAKWVVWTDGDTFADVSSGSAQDLRSSKREGFSI